MGPSECQVEDCGKPSVGRGLCRKHYNRWRKHGDPSVVKPYGWFRDAPPCGVDGCSEPHVAQGYCRTHYRRWKRWGDPLYVRPNPSGPDHPAYVADEDAGYSVAHARVRKARGKASDHLCVDCGKQANEWSYVGGAPNERVDSYGGKMLPYTTNPAYYVARCHSCHVRFDKRREG